MSEHPDVNVVEFLSQALIAPVAIRRSKYDERVRWHYLFEKLRRMYLLVAVKYLNGSGFIITAYYVRRIQ